MNFPIQSSGIWIPSCQPPWSSQSLCCCKRSLSFYKRTSNLALNFKPKRFYLLTIFNKISLERGPQGQWGPGRLSPQGPLSKEIVFFSHFFLSNLRVCVLFLCLHTTLLQNAPLPKCTWSGLANYTQPMCFTGLIFYYFHHATKIRRPARFKGSKGMSWHCDKEAVF